MTNKYTEKESIFYNSQTGELKTKKEMYDEEKAEFLDAFTYDEDEEEDNRAIDAINKANEKEMYDEEKAEFLDAFTYDEDEDNDYYDSDKFYNECDNN